MANFPRFAPPEPPEWRTYYSAIRLWFENGSGPPIERPDDPLARIFAVAKSGLSRARSSTVVNRCVMITAVQYREENLT